VQLNWKLTSVDEILPFALLGLTGVTGLVDAVSFLALGHVFTANMTGNIVFLGFAIAGVPEVSAARSLTALLAFLLGALVGGRMLAKPCADAIRASLILFGLEITFLAAAMFAAVGYHGNPSPASVSAYLIITFTAVAMGMRNAAVRKLGVADLTTTVLTLTTTGLAADSLLAGGTNPRWQRRLGSILAMFVGAAAGAILVRHSVFAALALGVATMSVCSAAVLAVRQRGLQSQTAKPV
jgi:uncharacterized membrane protein YoaK (UPF0700 family)